MESMDIYKKIRPYRKLLGLESMKQKAIEQFLGISREDKYTGGQLIEVYRDYLHTHEKSLYDLLILHNEDDLKGMPAILPILSYADFFSSPLFPQAPELWEGDCTEPTDTPLLHLMGTGSVSVPVPLEYSSGPVSLELYENKAVCTIRLCRGCLKYFYPDYKDYYYLPFEDTAVHKSVGEYVDRSARKKATARTCYTKKRACSSLSLAPLRNLPSGRITSHLSPMCFMMTRCFHSPRPQIPTSVSSFAGFWNSRAENITGDEKSPLTELRLR